MAEHTTTPLRHHRLLNAGQCKILDSLYRFRFGTTDLLAGMLDMHSNRRLMQARLRLLYEQGYIGRQYDRSYRLRGLFATLWIHTPNALGV